MRQLSLTLILLIAVIALAAFFRFFALETIPPGLYPDEAMNGVNALHALESGDFKVFYPDNNGREGLFINIQALAVQLFDATPKTLRMVSAIMGTLTALALYFAARELELLKKTKSAATRTLHLFGYTVTLPTHSERVALTASFFLAISLWHVNFSRIGFRAIMTPLLISIGVALLLRGIRLRHRLEYAAAGLAFGLLSATYIGGRFAFLILPLFFVADMALGIRTKRRVREMFMPWVFFSAVLLVVALPMIGYFTAHPQDFFGRAGGVSIFAAENPIKAAGDSVVKTLLMFNVRGDGNWRHNLGGSPQLNTLIGIVMLAGLALTLRSLFGRRDGTRRSLFPNVVLLGWLMLMLLPTVLSAEGTPHALRAIGAIPPLLILSARGFIWIWDRIRTHISMRTAVALAFAILMITGNIEFYRYFFLWASNPNVPGAFRQDLSDIAHYLVTLPAEAKRVVIVNESAVLLDDIPMSSASLRFLTDDTPSIQYLTPERIGEIEPLFDHAYIVTTKPPSQELVTSLRAEFPSLKKEPGTITVFRL